MKTLTTGSQVDQFRIVRKLGQGGMSEVYLARDTVLGRKVALKIIRADLVDTPRRLKFFLHEARLTAKFSHPHIITIYTVGEVDGHPYLALEHLEGQTLRRRMREGSMSARETMRIGLAIAQALEEAHSHDVLHRDLKPANVIIPQDGRLRVLDFGISKIIGDSLHPPAPATDLACEIKPEDTVLGELKGTPAYMAPERWLGVKVTGSADVWALGVILYQALTQTHPFPGEDRRIEAVARRILSAQSPPSLPQDLNVPPELSQLINSMLYAESSRRPTAKQVVEVLQDLLQQNRGQTFENRNPFRGLLPFSERHANLFFGRSAEIEMAVERLRNEPILPIVGPSGAGKSSFVAAGVVPRLRELDSWLVLTVRPGTDPFGVLGAIIQAGWKGDVGPATSTSNTSAPIFEMVAKSLRRKEEAPTLGISQKGMRKDKGIDSSNGETVTASVFLENTQEEQNALSGDTPEARRPPSNELAQKLQESPATLLLELQALSDERRANVLLFVDQLEELYTLEHEPSVRQSYMEAISRAADDSSGPIRVILTLREDFLSRVVGSATTYGTLTHIMVLGAPGEEALFETVTNPVELAGYSYEDESLPEEMVEAVRNAPASLPLIQFACNQLWNRRDTKRRLITRAAYQEMGGVEGALASKADELLAGLSEAQRRVSRQLMLRLVTPEGTRRVITMSKLLDGLDSSAVLVLDRLTAARMLVSRRAAGAEGAEAELELVHDSLIHSWKPLVRWLEQSREEVVFLDEVSRAAELWDSRGQPSEEVWSGGALEEALTKIERCEGVPKSVEEFLEAGVLQRQARARRRRNVRLAITGALLVVIAVLALMNRETEIQRSRAIAMMEEAREKHEHERSSRASALREGARAAYIKGDYLEARSKLRASLEVRDSTQARSLWWLLKKEPLVLSESLSGFANCVSVSPDGRLIAAGSGQDFVYIYDIKTFERRVLRGHKGQVWSVSFSPDGQWLSSSASDNDIRLWNLREGTVKVLKGHMNSVHDIAFCPDGKRLISGGRDHTIEVWDIQSGDLLRTIQSQQKVTDMVVSTDGRFIISVHSSDTINLWNAQSYELDHVIVEPGMSIYRIAISTDGKLLAYGGSSGVVVVRDLEKNEELRRISDNTGNIRSLDFSPNNDFIATAANHGKVWVWDTDTWSLRSYYEHGENPVNSIAVLPEGKLLVSACLDGTLNLWNVSIKSSYKGGDGHRGPVYGLAFAPDGKTIATGGTDGYLRLWGTLRGHNALAFHGHRDPISNIEFQRSGKVLASTSFEGDIRLWSIPDGKLLKTLRGHGGFVSRVLFTPDDTQMISSGEDRTISFWDMKNMKKNKSIFTNGPLGYIDIDSTGRYLISAIGKKIEVRDTHNDRVIQTFSGHSDGVKGVVFSYDNKTIYSSSFDSTVRRYLLGGTSKEGEVIARHNGNIYWIDTSPTEDILGTPSEDRTAKIWRFETGEIVTLNGHQSEVNALKFSPDGTTVATVSDDSTLRLWDAKTGRSLWRAPLMLEWTDSGSDNEPAPSIFQWQKAVEDRGELASVTAGRETLCLTSLSDDLEIWDIPNDNRTFKRKQPGIEQILAIRNGCLTLTAGTLVLTKTLGDAIALGNQVDAMSRFEDSVFVLQAGKIRILDHDGNQRDEFTATIGASALTIVGDSIALGFPDGRIEVWRREGSGSERVFICRETESTSVTAIIPGPPGTTIAGFANGTVGIWSIETGERLHSQHLHGRVIHLLHRDQTLWAASELGSRMRLDLSTFFTDYCELLNQVWSSVPWIWEDGRARYREIPSNHECARR